MPPADLTRFDFHVVRFMNSYDVEVMTAEEIGQYILLLCKSWLLAHDATLPDDIEYISRTARVTKVSDRVLAKFPVVETEQWGSVRRNHTLFEEWERASDRSDIARERVSRRSDRNPTVVDTAVGTTVRRPLISSAYPNQPIPNQSESNQPIPNQSESSQDVSVSVSSHRSADWKNFAIPYRNVFKKKAGTEFKKRYYEACSKYGEDVVLEYFHTWATDNQREWCEATGFDRPLNLFFKKLPEEAADIKDLNIAEKEEQTEAAEQRAHSEQVQAESIERQTQETIKFLTSQPPTTTGEGSVEDFLAGE